MLESIWKLYGVNQLVENVSITMSFELQIKMEMHTSATPLLVQPMIPDQIHQRPRWG